MSHSNSSSSGNSSSSASARPHSDKPPKPWSVAVFERVRPHLTNFVKRDIIHLLDDADIRRIVLRGPVKSGKREIVEYIAMRDLMMGESTRCHVFISAWHRVADEGQREELAKHNLKVFSITKEKEVRACVEWIRAQISAGKQVIIHLDECDHGSGQRQVLSRVWREVRDNAHIKIILYSATPEEVCFSSEIDDPEHNDMMEEMVAGCRVDYIPPEEFCGPRRFLDEGLVREAKPFFEREGTTYRITDQGREILAGLRASTAAGSRRNLLILRFSSGGRKDIKDIYQFLRNQTLFPELEGITVVADKGDKFDGIPGIALQNIDWSNKSYWDFTPDNRPVIIVIDQTSTRSTEWACHDRVFATHDFRNKITFSVVSQAQERVNHYSGTYGAFQPIRVYGSLKAFQLSAGRIDYKTFLTNTWKKKKERGVDLYRILNTTTGAIHPSYPEPISPVATDKALQELGCFADADVSARVTGTIKIVPTIRVSFHPCNRASFGALATTLVTGHTFQNPFDRSMAEMTRQGLPHTGPILGSLRGWKVLDYDSDLNSRDASTGVVYGAGWGFQARPGGTNGPRVTICYKEGVLGVALRVMTDTRPVDRLSAYRSMYPSRLLR